MDDHDDAEKFGLFATLDEAVAAVEAACETQPRTLTLDDPRDLPGHERGRQALITALHGEHCAVKVTGCYRDDTFVVSCIEDVYDGDEGCWASEYGSPLYPMAIEAT